MATGKNLKQVPEGEQPGGMEFEHYLAALGDLSEHRMCAECGFKPDVVRAIREGTPIALVYAKRIAAWLSKEYERDIQLSDIHGIQTVNPGRDPGGQQQPPAQDGGDNDQNQGGQPPTGMRAAIAQLRSRAGQGNAQQLNI